MQTLELSEGYGGNGYNGSFRWRGKLKLESGLTAKVEILQDEFRDESPRAWDNLGTMVCWHRDYILGDEQPKYDPQEYLKDLACSLDDTLEDRIWFWENGNGWAQLYNEFGNDAWKYTDEKVESLVNRVLDEQVPVMLPLYLYDHSGITMSCGPFSCLWDSGQVGFIYVTKETLRKEYNRQRITKATIKRAEKVLKQEVKTYDDYLTGNVWGYSIEVYGSKTCPECGTITHAQSFEDSCWGYLGNPRDYLLSEVNSILEHSGHAVKVEF